MLSIPKSLQVHGPQPTSLQVLLLQPTVGASLSMGFSTQDYWSGLPFLFSGDLPDPGIEPWSPVLQANSLPSELQGIFLLVFNLLSSFYTASVFCFQRAIHFSSAVKDTEQLELSYIPDRDTKWCSFPGDSAVKNLSAKAGNVSSIPG